MTLEKKLGYTVDEPKRVCNTTLPELLSLKKSLGEDDRFLERFKLNSPKRSNLRDIKTRVEKENKELNGEFDRLFDLYVHRGVDDPAGMRNLDRLARKSKLISQFGYSLPVSRDLKDYSEVRDIHKLRRRESHLVGVCLGGLAFLLYTNQDVVIHYGTKMIERFL